MIGPLLMFDKSFLQMLNPEEVQELHSYFMFAGTPLLIPEIIADLKLKPEDRRIPEKVVGALASKMSRAHGIQPANFRKLVIANLCCYFDVPMFGQIPVDPAAQNVFVTDGGKGVIYDSTLEQEMWRRWKEGNFTTDDQESATLWREGIGQLNLNAVGKQWKDFANENFGAASNLHELIALVNRMLDDFSEKTQFKLLSILMALLAFSIPAAQRVMQIFNAGLMPRIKDVAPYAASVLRLYLTFVGGLGRGFIGPRPTHYIDLQYLFYAPFCMVFVSSDKFHRDMWPATSGRNNFIWGPDLKKELKQRIEMRSRMTGHEKDAQKWPYFPKELQDSPIHKVWLEHIVLSMGDFKSKKPYPVSNTGAAKKRKKKAKTIHKTQPPPTKTNEKCNMDYGASTATTPQKETQ